MSLVKHFFITIALMLFVSLQGNAQQAITPTDTIAIHTIAPVESNVAPIAASIKGSNFFKRIKWDEHFRNSVIPKKLLIRKEKNNLC